jgi:hypothetical protein
MYVERELARSLARSLSFYGPPTPPSKFVAFSHRLHDFVSSSGDGIR